jgi:heme/copper-type cytochrome/quinol oxidase subunit 2
VKKLVIIIFVTILSMGRAQDAPYENYRVKTYQIQQEYLKKLADHQVSIMQDLEQKLNQQQWQTSMISIMVVIMVLAGIILSGLQFYSDFRSNEKPSVITLKIGSGSFEISSTVIGIVILALSFWFFQIYIDKVYSISIFNVQPLDVTTFGINR